MVTSNKGHLSRVIHKKKAYIEGFLPKSLTSLLSKRLSEMNEDISLIVYKKVKLSENPSAKNMYINAGHEYIADKDGNVIEEGLHSNWQYIEIDNETEDMFQEKLLTLYLEDEETYGGGIKELKEVNNITFDLILIITKTWCKDGKKYLFPDVINALMSCGMKINLNLPKQKETPQLFDVKSYEIPENIPINMDYKRFFKYYKDYLKKNPNQAELEKTYAIYTTKYTTSAISEQSEINYTKSQPIYTTNIDEIMNDVYITYKHPLISHYRLFKHDNGHIVILGKTYLLKWTLLCRTQGCVKGYGTCPYIKNDIMTDEPLPLIKMMLEKGFKYKIAYTTKGNESYTDSVSHLI